jgi:starch synthase
LFGVVSRLADQKGLDLLLGALPELLKHGGRVAVMGSGMPDIENKFLAAARDYPRKIAVYIGYDEALAHRIVAGADVIVVPSRFEPCGLTQMYGLAYGTLPLVRRVGGLADTVEDANAVNLIRGMATGFVFDAVRPEALAAAAMRAFALWRKPAVWNRMRETAMRQDFSWPNSARQYAELYANLRPRRAVR